MNENGTVPARGGGVDPLPEISLISFANVLLRNHRTLVILPILFGALAVSFNVLTMTSSATSKFVPQGISDASASRLAGLAAQFGFSSGALTGGESIDFYVELLRSKDLLTAVVQHEYDFTAGHLFSDRVDTLSGNWIELYGIEEDTPEKEIKVAWKQLAESMEVSRDLEAGIVTVTVSTKWGGLSVLVNRELLEQVNRFNLESRQSEAAARADFIEGRLSEAEADLEAAENELQLFLIDNRQYNDSPRLVFEANRLERRVSFRQQVYSTLLQGLEEARIEKVRDTPVITLMDRPEGSVSFGFRPLVYLVAGGGFGGFLAVVIVLGGVFLNQEKRDNAAEYAEFEALKRDTMRDLWNILFFWMRPFRRR